MLNLFLIKLKAFRLQHSCFPVNMTNFLRTPILKNICEQLLPLIIVEGKKIFLKKLCFTFIARIFVAATRRRRDIKIQFYLSAHVPLWTCNFSVTGSTLFEQVRSKNQNSQFKLKFGT